jgi:hypothetical protein
MVWTEHSGMDNKDVVAGVQTGLRLPRPLDCPAWTYEMMMNCWKEVSSAM